MLFILDKIIANISNKHKSYRKDWYDLDAKRIANEQAQKQNETLLFPNIPNCTTAEMVDVLQGHLSLSHANYANDNATIQQTGENVSAWREKMKKELHEYQGGLFNTTNLNKYRQCSYETVFSPRIKHHSKIG